MITYVFLGGSYTVLQRFEYQIFINNFPVDKCLSDSTRYKFNDKNLKRKTAYARLFKKPNVVAMATTDRDAWLVF